MIDLKPGEQVLVRAVEPDSPPPPPPPPPEGESFKHDPKRYGAVGDGSSDDTQAVQAAIDAAGGGVVDFSGGAYKVGELWIEKPMHILGHGSIMVGANNGIFGVRKSIPYLTIDGFAGFVFPDAPSGESSRDAIGNHDRFAKNDTEGFGYSDQFDYRVDTFRITNNVFDGCKVCVVDAGSGTWVERNKWLHSRPAAKMAPYWLCLEHDGYDQPSEPEPPAKSGPVWISRNQFNVHVADGWNQDMVKVTGSISNAQIHHNHLENLNPKARAQLDVFTGLHRMNCGGNSFIETQLHCKKYGESLGVQRVCHGVRIHHNDFVMKAAGQLHHPPIYFVGDRAVIDGNVFEVAVANERMICVWCDNANADVDMGLGGDASAAVNVSGNFADMRGGSGFFLNVDPPSVGAKPRAFIVNGNQLWGGSGLVNGDIDHLVESANLWMQS